MSRYDAIVIGAGAAGLACADHLLEAGINVKVLEARSRVGGRAHTLTHLCHPVELGAEFVHGAEPHILSEFQRAGLNLMDVIDSPHYLQNGKLIFQQGFWEEIEKIGRRLDPHRREDRSMEDFLKTQTKKAKPQVLAAFRRYLEGFHAADLSLFSEKALAQEEQQEADELNGADNFRPVTGYKTLMDHWLTRHGDSDQWLQLEAPVEKVEWRPGEVTVYGKTFAPLKSSTIVITLPLSILKTASPSGSFCLDPYPKELRETLDTLHMGHAERITFEFKQRFWEELTEKPIAFMQAPSENYFSVWWTQWPRRTPFLVAWQGGPKALEMSQWPEDKQVRTALTTLSKLTGKSVSALNKMLVGYHYHNWSTDPYSQGAYSYFGLGAADKVARLRKPFGHTLVIAGEASAEKQYSATVTGAMLSGHRAAKQVRHLLARSK